jgi:hypothetical protein
MKRPSTSFASVSFFFLFSFPWKYFIASRWFYDFWVCREMKEKKKRTSPLVNLASNKNSFEAETR